MSPNLQLGSLLWIAGMTGVIAILRVVPQLAAKKTTKLSPAALIAIALAQTAALLALAVWAGVAAAPRTGLRAPIFTAIVAGQHIPSLGPEFAAGILGAVLGGALLLAASAYARRRLPPQAQAFNPPLYARLLYGGITEELLLRWGVMSALAWLVARITQAPDTLASAKAIWIAIAASALLFAIGHLPAAATVFGKLTRTIVAYVIFANTAFGILAGFLFWRYGIEAAMIAHAGAHAIAFALGANAWGRAQTGKVV